MSVVNMIDPVKSTRIKQRTEPEVSDNILDTIKFYIQLRWRILVLTNIRQHVMRIVFQSIRDRIKIEWL